MTEEIKRLSAASSKRERPRFRLRKLWKTPLSLRARLLTAFVCLVIFVGALPAFFGIGYIHRILPQARDVLAVDLSAAQEIYREHGARIADSVRLLSRQGFVREGFGQGSLDRVAPPLQAIGQNDDLDLLYLTDVRGTQLYPVVSPARPLPFAALGRIVSQAIQQRKEIVSTVLLGDREMAAADPELAERASMEPVPTPYAPSPAAGDLGDGLMLAAAVPIYGDGGRLKGVVCGGQLLNRRNSIVDRIRSSLYRQEKFEGHDVAVVSIFLRGKRIATTAATQSGERRVGTMISKNVYQEAIQRGQKWVKPGYIVDDWYLTAYAPIRGPRGSVIGALGLGLLQRKFEGAERRALAILLILTVVAIVLSIVVSYVLSRSILKPVNLLVSATRAVASDKSPREINVDSAPPEIQELGHAFNGMVAAIKERDRRLQRQTHEKLMRSDRLAMVGQLAAGVAHEINNPLGSILLFSRLIMQQTPAEGRIRENLERIEKETKRCNTIVRSLLDFARDRKPLVEAVDVNGLMETTVRLFEGQFLFQNIRVVKDYAAGLPPIQGDQSQLQQVFMNIILNAVDAMNGKGGLTLATRMNSDEETVEIAISDTGCGIDPANLERVFDPFFTTKTVGHGTGLGLSVSYGIVQSHNGDITASNNPEGGAAFTVSLPVRGAFA